MQNIREFFGQFSESKAFKIISVIFVLIVLWWITIHARGLTEGWENDYFTLSYSIIALLGGVYGWVYAKKWGGLKSVLGSSLGMFSFGLLAQFIGQLLYSYYIFVVGVEVPYPSIGDAVFFISVLFYIYGAYLLAKVAGIKLSVGTLKGRLQAIFIPIIILLASYLVLLRGYEFDFSQKVIIFLDFGFPIGQAVYVSIAILALLISKNILGGMMRKPIMLLIIALIVQFIADFAFSYQFSHGTVYAGDILDLIYAVSYFLMAISLVSIGNMFYKVQES